MVSTIRNGWIYCYCIYFLCTWKWTVTSTTLCGLADGAFAENLQAQEKQAPVFPRGITVGAYYYPWHADDFHRGDGYIRDLVVPRHQPVLGEYDDRKPEVVSQHLKWSRQANIQLWVCSWWGPNKREDSTIRNSILTHPELADHQIALLYETTGRIREKENWEPIRVQDDMAHICKTYFDNENYYRIDDKPVIVMYLSRLLGKQTLSSGANALEAAVRLMRETAWRECQSEIYIVGDQVWRKAPTAGDLYPAFDILDAVTNYDIYGNMRAAPYAGADAVNSYFQRQADWKNAANTRGVNYIPAVSPGYNDRGVRLAKNNTGLSRRLTPDDVPGSLFVSQLQQARYLVDPGANGLMLVNSFNEWHEDSQIEPTIGVPTTFPEELTGGVLYEGYGELYLDLLRATTCDGKCTAKPKSSFEADPASKILVGAIYQTWYGKDFRGNKKFLRGELAAEEMAGPELGLYDDRDPLIIRKHVDWSLQANIGLWIVSFFGRDTNPDITLRAHVMPEMQPIKLALQYEIDHRISEGEGWDLQKVRVDITHICRTYFNHDIYYMVNGKAVIFLKLTRKWFELGLLENIVETIRATAWELGYEVYLIGDQVWQKPPTEEIHYPFFALDAVINIDVYGNLNASENYASESEVDALYNNQRLWRNRAWANNCDFIPSVTPGFHNRASNSGLLALSRSLGEDQAPGSFFEESVRKARYLVDNDIDNLLVVNSFNNWFEDTQIEPARGSKTGSPQTLTQGIDYMGYGDLYLQILNRGTQNADVRFSDVNEISTFRPLKCNDVMELSSSDCKERWSQVFGLTSNHSEEIVIPCGKCVVLDHSQKVLKLSGGIDIQGKLLIPDGYAIQIETPYIRVQGELNIISTDTIRWGPKVKFIFTDAESGIENFHGSQNNKDVCGTTKCEPGPRSVVVAGGRMNVQGVPTMCPTWTKLVDVISRSEPPPLGIQSCGPKDQAVFAAPGSGMSATLGSTVLFDGRSALITNRRTKYHGVQADLTSSLKCLQSGDFFVVSFQARTIRPGMETNLTQCATDGDNCIELYSDFLHSEEYQITSASKYRLPPSAIRYGEWVWIEEWITFEKDEVDDQNSFLALRIGGGEVGTDLEIRNFELKIAPEPTCSETPNDCQDLIKCNGNAELGLSESPFRTQGNVELKVERENGQQFWRIIRRNSKTKEDGVQFSVPSQCAKPEAIYKFRMKVRVYDTQAAAVIVQITFQEASSLNTRRVVVCPKSEGDWVLCEGFYQMPSDLTQDIELSLVTVNFVVEGNETADYDIDDLSFTFERMGGDVKALILNESVVGKWGIGASILITSHTIDWRDQQVRKIAGIRSGEKGTTILELDEDIPRPASTSSSIFAVEVALLTRNIAFIGGAGLTVLNTPGVQQSIVGVRFVGFGSLGKEISRHPIYFQSSGNTNKSVVSKNTIERSKNGCIVVSKTGNIQVTDNVAFDTASDCFVLGEGGVQNIIKNNLGAKTKPGQRPPEGTPGDTSWSTPSTFMITDSDNYVEGNVAAGSRGQGFTLAAPRKPNGELTFRENIAHSNRIRGMHVFSKANSVSDYQSTLTIEELEIYRNEGLGLLVSNIEDVSVERGHFVDNMGAIAIDASSSVKVTNSMVVGYSEELQLVESTQPMIKLCADSTKQIPGIQLGYNSRNQNSNGLKLENTTFGGFDGLKGCNAYAIAMEAASGWGPFSFFTAVSRLEFDSSATGLSLCESYENAIRDVYLIDDDGSLRPSGTNVTGTASIISMGSSILSFLEADTVCHHITDGCYHYCEDLCLRTIVLSIDPAIEELPMLLVCRRDEVATDVPCELFQGTLSYQNEADLRRNNFVPKSVDYSITLPKGRFEAHFVDSNDRRIWPKFVEVFYHDELCARAIEPGSVWTPAPPINNEVEYCKELLSNGDIEDTIDDATGWISGKGGMQISPSFESFGGTLSGQALCDGLITDDANRLFSFGQYLDTRCLEEGNLYEISVQYQNFDANHETLLETCPQDVPLGECKPQIGVYFVSNDGYSWLHYFEPKANIFSLSVSTAALESPALKGILLVDANMASASSAFFFIRRGILDTSEDYTFCVDDLSISRKSL